MTAIAPHPQAQLEEPLSAALDAAARGWHVFPLRPNDKRPAVRDWEARATTDPERIRRCWNTAPYGVGIATGPSGLVILDLDTPKPGQTPPEDWAQPGVTCGEDVLASLAHQDGQPYPTGTHTVTTASGGRHLYFTAAPDTELRNTSGRLGWLIDTRAHGGYVAAPGTTINGQPYTTTDDTDPALLPEWLHERLCDTIPQPPDVPAPPPVVFGSGYLAAAISAETRRVADAHEGQRNQALYIAATALGQLVAGGVLPAENVCAALLVAARDQIAAGAYDTRQAEATIASGLRAGTKRPRTIEGVSA